MIFCGHRSGPNKTYERFTSMCYCYHRMGHTKEIWELLKTFLPEFQLPELVSAEERAASEEQRNKEETPVVSSLEVTTVNPFIGINVLTF